MNKLNKISPKATFLLIAVLMPIVLIFTLSSAYVGLSAINPENHGKIPVYPLGDETTYVVQVIDFYVVAPLSVLLFILGGLNLKFKNALLNSAILLISLFLVGWWMFSNWAVNVQFVDPSDASQSGQVHESGDLKVRTLNLR